MPKNISFIIPAYNCKNTIKQSINSILEGNFEKGDEIVIVDDHSTDGTGHFLDEFVKNSSQIKVIRHPENRGGGAARNTAVRNATNDLIFCLDSDNLLAPNSISALREFMFKNNLDSASFGEFWYFDSDKTNVTHKWIAPIEVITLSDFFASSTSSFSSGNYLYTKESWSKAGGYPESVKALDAWGFGFRQLMTGTKMQALPGLFYFHRYGYASYYVATTRTDNISHLAFEVIKPNINLFTKESLDYIMGEGKDKWYENLNRRPLHLINQSSVIHRGQVKKISIRYKLISLLYSIKRICRLC